MTPGRAALPLAACLAACAGGAMPGAPPATPASAPTAPAPRLLYSAGEGDFVALHTPDRDLVVASGARIEATASGEITAIAWDLELSRRGELLTGSLVVPERLGGGFVHWSRTQVFRSQSFTGALQPVNGDAGGAVRGARAGTTSVVVLTDAGPRELLPGATQLRGHASPGILDLGAVADGRAVRLDVFGRVTATQDGKRFVDLTPWLGLGARHVVVGDGELLVETNNERLPIRADGKLGEPSGRPVRDANKLIQIAWKDPRLAERAENPWAIGGLAAAVSAGADAGDGTGFGVVQGTLVRVDLRTGQLVAVPGEWAPNGLTCQPARLPDGLLFACTWERYQGYGGYVMRSVEGAPPVVERAFSDDGAFVADDAGALGFVGSCRAEARFFDPDEVAAGMSDGAPEKPIPPVMCVRRGAGEWVERRMELGEGETLVAWVPGRDGSAAALVTSAAPLPPPASAAGRTTERAGVRVIHVDPEYRGWKIAAAGGKIDRSYRLREDGSVDLWVAPAGEPAFPITNGATLDPRGTFTIHPTAPGMVASSANGRFGVAVSRDGDLYETVDFGRSWRLAGRSPVPPGAVGSQGCSALGCWLGPVVRLGWGDSAITPRVQADALPQPTPTPPSRRLACSPAGSPAPLAAPPPFPPGARSTVSTPWGESLEMIRDAAAPEPPPAAKPAPTPAPTPAAPKAPPAKAAPPAPSAAPAAPKKPPRPSPAVLRTHTLVVRTPFSLRGPPRRLNATDAAIETQRRSLITPLLGPKGDMEILLTGDRHEAIVAGDRITVMPVQDGSRRGTRESLMGGVVTAPGRMLLLAEHRRRLALEEHGATTAPLLIGAELDPFRKRPIALGRRDDGAVSVLVLDGPAPETAGAAVLDRVTASPGPITPLAAWSTLVSADDPACREGADPSALRAILVVDPSVWLALDETSLHGFAMGRQGLVQVRWGRERVCLEAIDAALVDQRTRSSAARPFRLVARWAGDGDRGAALRAPDVSQDLVCRVAK